jgi:hypothetical protein
MFAVELEDASEPDKADPLTILSEADSERMYNLGIDPSGTFVACMRTGTGVELFIWTLGKANGFPLTGIPATLVTRTTEGPVAGRAT